MRYLHGKPTMFDEQALKWIDEHRANPSDVVNGLKYFVETWRAAVDERTSATVGSLRALIRNIGCTGPLVTGGDVWADYLAALDVILTPKLKAKTLEGCVGHLDRE